MSTKEELILDLDGEIDAVGKVTKTRHTNANEFMVNEFYSTPVTDNEATTSIIEVTAPSADYNVEFNKVGNKVFVNGTVKVFGSTTLPASSIYATFTSAEFKPKDNKIYYINGIQQGTGVAIVMAFHGGTTTGVIRTGRPMSPATDYTINGWYLTND